MNNFINSKNSQILTIKKEALKIFSIIIKLLILLLSLPVLLIVIYPITTYSFNSKKNSWTVTDTALSSTKKTNNQEFPILLIINDRQEYIKDFKEEKVLPKILELIKPFTTVSAKNS